MSSPQSYRYYSLISERFSGFASHRIQVSRKKKFPKNLMDPIGPQFACICFQLISFINAFDILAGTGPLTSLRYGLLICGICLIAVELILFIPFPCPSNACMHLAGALLFYILSSIKVADNCLIAAWVFSILIPFLVQLIACYKPSFGCLISRSKAD
jgi:hypothetical protein